jgi:beta-1,4-mannosyl-glycoprotein beta-1,4-N-acetylglucosaminyltransferase
MPEIMDVSKSPLDIAMISDCDEIPRASALKDFEGAPSEICGTQQDMFYYTVNNYVGEWHGTMIGSVQQIKDIGGPQAMRNRRDQLPRVPNCGWHFSYFGGLDRIRKKTENFAHANEDPCQILKYRPDEELVKDIKERRDLYHRPEEMRPRRMTNDQRLPKYFLDNVDRFDYMTDGMC